MRRFRWWHTLLGHNMSVHIVDAWRCRTDCTDCGDSWAWWRHWLGTIAFRQDWNNPLREKGNLMLTNEQAAHEITKQILIENIPNIGIAANALAASIIAALAEVELITEDEGHE
jgi:hypothetical protein